MKDMLRPRRPFPFADRIGLLLLLAGLAGGGPRTAGADVFDGDADPGRIVAEDVAGRDQVEVKREGQRLIATGPYFTTGTDWDCPPASVPVAQVPPDAPERAMKFGPSVTLVFPGVDPQGGYTLGLSFLSDTGDRKETIRAGGRILEEGLALPAGRILRKRWAVPAAACADGKLVVEVSAAAGGTAVVSRATLWAADPAAQPIPRPSVAIDMPRPPLLSPRASAVSGVAEPRFDLGGAWKFEVAPMADLARATAEPPAGKASDIEVPGQWVEQGFTVGSGMSGVYQRAFTLPGDWAGRRVKLRCDGVYSEAAVWVDGRLVGRHRGGFTPFEIDVTDAVQPGRQGTLVLAVQGTDAADGLAAAIGYASHDLGGIPRKIAFVALPPTNLASLHIDTPFDEDLSDASLEIVARIANDGAQGAGGGRLSFALSDPEGRPVAVSPARVELPEVAPGGEIERKVSLPVARPLKWDPEHPRLYTLVTRLETAAGTETVATRVGFRKVEVRGQRLFVNGRAVRLRGVCRHEIDPLRGRSMTDGDWRRDAELFARANVNFIRTSHYPPAEEFLDACDEVGLFVEVEAPVCWAGDRQAAWPLLLDVTQETVEFNRNHPSVILWSLANESDWSLYFAISSLMVHELDPGRPRIFNNGNRSESIYQGVDIASWHYPGNSYLPGVDHSPRPVQFDEYAHLNVYNQRELLADPGLRDAWGFNLAGDWEMMRAHPACLGGSIWAGIDDTFFLPGGRAVGYGPWGILDAWRRPKPEYWHTAKVYSPVRVAAPASGLPVPSGGAPIVLAVENRSEFSDLSELRFAWKLAGGSGIARAEGAPGATGTLSIPAGDVRAGQELEIEVADARGLLIDAYRFVLGEDPAAPPPPLRPAGPVDFSREEGRIVVSGTDFSYGIDAATGQLVQADAGSGGVALFGPCLTVVPDDHSNDNPKLGAAISLVPQWGLATAWKASSVTVAKKDGQVVVTVAGAYAEAKGGYTLAIDGAGRMTVAWKFTAPAEIYPHQTGMTFLLPKGCDTLSWRRRGQWSAYPGDHIGRLAGTARAFTGHPDSGIVGPSARPTWPWSEDQTPYGSNDFRSTKLNILEASLCDPRGLGLRAVAAADRHAHAWIDGEHADLLVADYANEGRAPYVALNPAIPDRPIPRGGSIAGSIQVEVTLPAR